LLDTSVERFRIGGELSEAKNGLQPK